MEDLNKKPDRWLADEFAQAKERACEFRFNPAGDSDLKPAGVPI
jgi:hypothetical protein